MLERATYLHTTARNVTTFNCGNIGAHYYKLRNILILSGQFFSLIVRHDRRLLRFEDRSVVVREPLMRNHFTFTKVHGEMMVQTLEISETEPVEEKPSL